MGYSTGSMESCSSGEEVVVKARKPYTITKQRERWTEEEHGRFLEALKLYGRAWQRIEEHIGTKTAIQIRSHAQKFFTKLEKEALTKGIPPGQTIDIEIPPPRPKRKPSNPYPRKTCVVASSSTKEDKHDKLLAASHSSSPNVEAMKLARTETSEKVTEGQGNEASTEILALFTDGPLTSASSKESTRNPVVFREFVPSSRKDKKVKIPVNEVSTAGEENKRSEQCTNDVSAVNICKLDELHTSSQAKTVSLEMKKKHGEPEKIEISSINDPEHSENYQKHAPVHPVHEIEKDGEAAPSHPRNTMSAACQQPAQINNDAFRNPSSSTVLEQHTDSSVPGLHQIPGFPPFCLPYGQDAYRSFFNASSNFLNLVVSTLVQNPAAHAAATITASFWPGRESDRSKNTTAESLSGTIPAGNMSPHPSMASIASATVAAATAWWAMHGLLPVCHPPFSTSFPFVSAAATSNPIVATNHIEEKNERRVDTSQILPDQDKSILDYSSPEHLMLRRSASKSAASSDSDESKGLKRSDGTNKDSSGIDKLSSTPEDNCQGRSRKRKPDFCRDRSKHSCSETVVEKNHPCQESLEDSLADHASIVDNRTPGCGYSVNEPRKGVSEEGRLAFQALFSREELPQSFSPSSPEDGVSGQGANAGAATPSVDLNNNAHAYSRKHDHVSGSGDIHMRNTGSIDKLSSCETENSKPRARRMGFKPYKRCSMEANVGRVNSEEEKGGKRLHVEAKTSNL